MACNNMFIWDSQWEVGKLQGIQQLPVPKAKRNVRAFLGITGYLIDPLVVGSTH